MAAFQSGFQMGAGLFQQAVLNKEREADRQAQAEERALRMEAARLGLDAQRDAAAQRRDLATIRQGIADAATGLDRGATNAALNADFDQALAASDAGVKAENAARQGVAPAVAPAAMPAVQGGSNAANEAALTVRRAVDPGSTEYRTTMNNLQRQYAATAGDMGALRALDEEGRKILRDGTFAALMKEYSGSDEQIGSTIEWVNDSSKRITMGNPDKNGLVRLSVVGPDRRAEFTKLSRAEQAKLYAAVRMMQNDPEHALGVIGGINKTLAEAIAADNNLTSALAGNTNDVASKGQTMTLARNADVRAGQAALDARDDRATTRKDREALRKAQVALEDATQKGDAAAIAQARRGILAAGGTLPAPAKVESSFTPDAIGSGGTVTQRQPDGSVTVTRMDSQGRVAATQTIPRPGAAAPGSRPGAGAKPPPPPRAVEALRKNPDKAAEFDLKYGAGAARQILGGSAPAAPAAPAEPAEPAEPAAPAAPASSPNAEVRAARLALQQWGLRQRQADPQGFAAAQQRLQAALRAAEAAREADLVASLEGYEVPRMMPRP